MCEREGERERERESQGGKDRAMRLLKISSKHGPGQSGLWPVSN